jgi:hypothetical protein
MYQAHFDLPLQEFLDHVLRVSADLAKDLPTKPAACSFLDRSALVAVGALVQQHIRTRIESLVATDRAGSYIPVSPCSFARPDFASDCSRFLWGPIEP